MTTGSPVVLTPHLSVPDTGKGVVNFQNTKFWAERGLIHWEDKTTAEYGVLDAEEFKFHLAGINDMCRNSVRRHQHDLFPDQLRDHQRFVIAGAELVDKAREQGSPSDPSAAKDLKRRRPRMFVFNSSQSYQAEL